MAEHRHSGPKLSRLQHTCCEPDCNDDPLEDAPVPLCAHHLARVVRYFHDEVRIRHGFDWGSGVNPTALLPQGERQRPKPTKPPVVYFVRLADRIKIGMTTDLPRRLTEIPHDEVLLVVPGGRDVEAEHHRRFARWHLTGEWFRYTDACAEAVREVG